MHHTVGNGNTQHPSRGRLMSRRHGSNKRSVGTRNGWNRILVAIGRSPRGDGRAQGRRGGTWTTHQYWHQKRSMWASLGRVSTVLKHSNAGMAYPNRSLHAMRCEVPESARVVADSQNPVERGTFVRRPETGRGVSCVRAVDLQQDLGEELPQHVAWPRKCPRARRLRAAAADRRSPTSLPPSKPCGLRRWNGESSVSRVERWWRNGGRGGLGN